MHVSNAKVYTTFFEKLVVYKIDIMSISFHPMKSEINNENALALFINLALVDIDTRENVT